MNLSLSAEFYPCGMPEARPGRAGIMALEQAMKDFPPELQIEAEERTVHHFAPGIYAREIVLKPGDCLVGKIHKHDHLAMLVYGTMTIADENGAKTVTGPMMFKSERGAKRAGYAHTDAAFITFHPTEETDVSKIEEEVIAPSFEALEAYLLESKQ